VRLQTFSEAEYHYFIITAQQLLDIDTQYHRIVMQGPENKVVGPLLRWLVPLK